MNCTPFVRHHLTNGVQFTSGRGFLFIGRSHKGGGRANDSGRTQLQVGHSGQLPRI